MGRLEFIYNHRAGAVAEGETGWYYVREEEIHRRLHLQAGFEVGVNMKESLSSSGFSNFQDTNSNRIDLE